MDARSTWILLHRDVSESVRVRGERATDIAIVLDQARGLVVNVQIGTSRASTVGRVLKDALIRPASPLPKVVPERIVCPPDLIETVRDAASTLSKLADTSLIEGVEMWDAEEIFDGLIGHLEGRAQPADPPSVGDWHVLYGTLEAYVAAAPWQRWSDSDYFPIRLDLEDDVVERTGIVLGAAGIQRGFNFTTDPEALSRAADEAGNPLQHLDQALIVHLSRWRDTSGLFADKARRYGWQEDAELAPELLTVRDGAPADLSGEDARLLALALRAVIEQDAKRVVAVGSPPVAGQVAFEGGVVGRYEIERP